jgi:acyl carrier protein
MSRDEVLDVVRRQTLAVLIDLDPNDFSPARSLRELGARSLDILEIVSASMKTLKIKVPRAELNGISNIDGLVDLLHTHAQKT